MSNRIHLEDVAHTNAAVLVDLPVDQLYLLASEADEAAKAAANINNIVKSAIAAKFETRAVSERRSQGKDTGTVRLIQGDYEVVANAPKRVEWDQAKLPNLLDRLSVDLGDSLLDKLVKVEIKIDERAFLALDLDHQAILMDARTVKTGRAVYEILPLAEV